NCRARLTLTEGFMRICNALAAVAITAAVGAPARGAVIFGDFESGTAPGFGALTNAGVVAWSSPVNGQVITFSSGAMGAKVLELTGNTSFNFGQASGAALGFDFLSQNLRSAFLANNAIEFDWYPVPNGGSGGFSQLYNVQMNSQGGGFQTVNGYGPPSNNANMNQFYFTGYNGV